MIRLIDIKGKRFEKPATLLTMTGPEGRASKRNPKRRYGPRVGPEKEIPNEMLGLKSPKFFCKKPNSFFDSSERRMGSREPLNFEDVMAKNHQGHYNDGVWSPISRTGWIF